MILLILFLPVAIYLIWVGGISRQSRPVIVNGSWDFVALVFAASGLILVGIPAVITSLNDTWRRYWLTGEGVIPLASLEGSRWFWISIWFFYFVMVVILVSIFIYRRRCFTCFYNIDSNDFNQAINDAIADSRCDIRKFGNFYLLNDETVASKETMEVEVFPLLRNGSIFFNQPEGLVSRQINDSVSNSVQQMFTKDHWGGLILIFLGFFILFVTVIGQIATAILLH